MTIADKFWRRVDRGAPEDCWQWGGPRDAKGYGLFWHEANLRAHRLAYELEVGPIPAGLQIDHLCRNKGCVNPKHMEPVTSAENTYRGTNFAAINKAKTRCANGHEYSPENTHVVSTTGARMCRICQRANEARAWNLKKSDPKEGKP